MAIYLPNSTKSESQDSIDSPVSQKSKLSRVDFKGAILFALTVLTLLLPLEIGGIQVPWSHPSIPVFFGLSAVLLFAFIAVEKKQEEPILPLEIFHRRDAVFSFAIIALQSAAQLGVGACV